MAGFTPEQLYEARRTHDPEDMVGEQLRDLAKRYIDVSHKNIDDENFGLQKVLGAIRDPRRVLHLLH